MSAEPVKPARKKPRARASTPAPALLSVRDLRVEYAGPYGAVRAVDGVSFDLAPGERLALVGESGSGKTALALALARLHPEGAQGEGRARVTGRVRFDGRELYEASERELDAIRGARIGFVMQDPTAAMNPVLTVGAHVEEPLRIHQGLRGGAARRAALAALERARVPEPERRYASYPHELSVGSPGTELEFAL